MCDCGDMPETYRLSRPRAKREHKCCECGGTIRAGETYRSFWGVWDGEAKTYKTCADCEDLHAWCEDDGGELCTTFGNLHTDVLDYMHECGDRDREAEAKRRVREIRAARRSVCQPATA